MATIANPADRSPFSNQIDTLRADNNYYERLIEENNKLIQQLNSAQDMVKQFLALGEEAIEFLKKIDQRFVEVVKESALRLFGEDNSDSCFSSDLLPSYVKSPNGYGVGFTFEYQNNSDTIEEFSPSPNSVTSYQLPVKKKQLITVKTTFKIQKITTTVAIRPLHQIHSPLTVATRLNQKKKENW